MSRKARWWWTLGLGVGLAGLGLWLARYDAHAHCDTLDGPVVKDARVALEQGDVTPVLKWVKEAAEPEVRAAFQKALTVRGKGPEVRALADQYFFETLVRIHRAGEGAPFTGLKPAGTDPGPAVREADEALERGNADALVEMVTKDVAAGIRARLATALAKKAHAAHSVQTGREYVAAYVDYVHFVEGIAAAARSTHHHGEAEAGGKTAAQERHAPEAGGKTEGRHEH